MNKKNIRSHLIRFIVMPCGIPVVMAACVHGPNAGAPPREPSAKVAASAAPRQIRADDVIERWLDAVALNGKRVFPTSTVLVQTMRAPALNMKAEMTTAIDFAGQRMIQHMKSPRQGDAFIGVVDGTAWTTSSVQGARIIKGAERAFYLRALADEADYKSKYETRSYLGASEVDGEACHRLRLEPSDGGAPLERCYATATGYILQEAGTYPMAGGMIPVTSTFYDFRATDGYVLPFRETIEMGAVRMEVTTQRIDTNVPLADEQFNLPQTVQALLKKSPALSQTNH